MSNNYFKSLDVDAKDKENVSALAKEIRGDNKNRKKKVAPTEGGTKERSNSHQSYDNLVANFKKYITLLRSFPEYAPNETDISIATIATYADDLRHSTIASTPPTLPSSRAEKTATNLCI